MSTPRGKRPLWLATWRAGARSTRGSIGASDRAPNARQAGAGGLVVGVMVAAGAPVWWAARLDWVLFVVIVVLTAINVVLAVRAQRARRDQAQTLHLARENYALRALLHELGVSVDLRQTGETIAVTARWTIGAPIARGWPPKAEVRH